MMLRKEAVLYNVKVFATIQPRSVSYQCSNGFQAIIRVVKGQYWLKIGDRETPKDSLQVALVRLRFEFIHFVDPKRVVVPDL
ncbi:hypothetical protein AB4571_02900 [Vibrio breoganii]|uniref:hypothetical protein n=1 Tax=Vibrio breoganii TaxID=553239 RepID=UPI0010554C89|nr:hypothetical protein [Vibrio breoganii]